jgi:type IV pilus assembly protein PilV
MRAVRKQRIPAQRVRSKGRRHGSGFTLLETMIALSILAVGVLGATLGQIAALKNSSASRKHSLGLQLAQQQLEIFQTMPASDVLAMTGNGTYPNDPSNPIDPDPGDQTTMAFDRSWTIESNTPETGLMRLTVSVSWTDSLGQTQTDLVQALRSTL